MNDIGTSENLRVDPDELRRVADRVDGLPIGADNATALVNGVARLRAEAGDLASTEATEQLVNAALDRLAAIAAAATAFAENLRAAADGYVRADDAAQRAITAADSEHRRD